jgi:predicted transposase YbfD/YdcC
LCTGQKKVEEKSNKITALHHVLSSLNIDEVAVSVDATGTQTKMAEQITDQGKHFFLPVKGNLPGLPDDLEHALSVDKGVTFIAEVEGEQGRIENRRCSI